jgi:hypothetical protein
MASTSGPWILSLGRSSLRRLNPPALRDGVCNPMTKPRASARSFPCQSDIEPSLRGLAVFSAQGSLRLLARSRFRVRIEPSAENRWLEVIADSDGFLSQQRDPAGGDRAPATIYFEFPGVPEGEYDIVGIVKDAAGHERSSVRDQVRVL